jgi:hypothetical protein
LKGWPEQATTDPALIHRWWRQWPRANVGIVTGAKSSLIALDVDPRHGGDESLCLLESRHGPVPRTARQLTGGGGEHLLFCHPGFPVGNQQGTATLAAGLDVRGDGGQIVAAPSFAHPGGRPYAWSAEFHPDDTPVAAAPSWLLALLQAGSRNGHGPAAEVPAQIGAGARNATLASLAGTLRRRGMTAEDIGDFLSGLNARRCVPPLAEAEVRTIAASIGRYAPEPLPVTPQAAPKTGPASRWAAAVSAPAFLSATEPDADFLEDRQLARGSVTEWFSPRGLGKTLAAHALAVKHALDGRRVILIDRDNSRGEVKRRLREWGADQAPTLKVLTRDNAPALTDRPAWAAFPFSEFDLVIIDSIDSATEGVGENDSAKPAAALAPILDIAHREAGPAILLLGNVIKSGSHGRGSGVVEDRADIVYEVRDATDLRPTGSKPWWLELPAAGREAWGERAARRKRRKSFRLAFIASKYRIGEEPDPFIWEVDLTTEPWTLRDVTAEVDAAGQAAVEAAEADRRQRREAAARALVVKVEGAVAVGQPWTTTQAETFLVDEHGLKRKPARQLIADQTGILWRIVTDQTRRGHPGLLFSAVTSGVGASGPTAAKDIGEKSPPSEGSSYAARSSSGRRETQIEIPAPDAEMRGGVVLRRRENTSLPPCRGTDSCERPGCPAHRADESAVEGSAGGPIPQW